MDIQSHIKAYTRLLEQELKLSIGCTEPVAIAHAAAYSGKVLGRPAER